MEIQAKIKHLAYINQIDNDIESTLRAGLEFVKWDKIINRNSRVFIKPNFTVPRYQEGITTTPRLLECLLKIVTPNAGSVILGESDGGNNSFKAEEAFKGHDVYRMCKERNVEVVNLSTLPKTTIEVRIAGKTVSVELPRMLLEDIDCLITVPVLKVHVMTTVTLGIKNLWGCVPDTMRGMHHQNLSYKLALIAKLLKPRITLIDGIYALNKHGPMFGESVKTNLIVVADNIVAADALGARLIGFSPERIEHIAIAGRAGLGSINPIDVDTNKEWQQYVRQFCVKKTFIDRLSTIPFRSDALAKLIFDSPLTPPIYKVAGLLKSHEEKKLSNELGNYKRLSPY